MYVSTRGAKEENSSAAAIAAGLATDGGLFVPVFVPAINEKVLVSLAAMSYQERAVCLLQKFLPDYTEGELAACVDAAYSEQKFDTMKIAPLTTIDDKRYVLELWHGPTSAFKDMALQLLPQLLSTALQKIGEQAEIAILVATSGDTGKAALEGFKDVEQIKVAVFYPRTGVSEIQRLQMVTQAGDNLAVVAVEGNFDDAQTGVKKIFGDAKFRQELGKRKVKLSSANSINWGRLAPQIVYYFSAYADLLTAGRIKVGEQVNFVVPTGNFGNILAGYYAKLMGLPVNRLICASNSNNVLTDFLQTGKYDRQREFHKTLSPSMDILISSNLERLLYMVTKGDTAKVAYWMNELNTVGSYQVGDAEMAVISQTFSAAWVDDKVTLATINAVYQKHNYVLDPHTAVAWQAADNYCQTSGDTKPCIVVSTASPFKFNTSVLSALTGVENSALSEFEILRKLGSMTGWVVPPALLALESQPVRHKLICQKDGMAKAAREALHLL